jgi:hypothetical protein
MVVLGQALAEWSNQHGGAPPNSLATLAADDENLLPVLTEDPHRQQSLRALASTRPSVPDANARFEANTDFVYCLPGGRRPDDAATWIVSKRSLPNGERVVLTRGYEGVQRPEPVP